MLAVDKQTPLGCAVVPDVKVILDVPFGMAHGGLDKLIQTKCSSSNDTSVRKA
jgi:hypothetical protein